MRTVIPAWLLEVLVGLLVAGGVAPFSLLLPARLQGPLTLWLIAAACILLALVGGEAMRRWTHLRNRGQQHGQ